MPSLVEPATTQAAVAAPADAPRLHLPFLDGIRALAALYVAIGHTVETTRIDEFVQPAPVRALLAAFRYGHWAVGPFIVLSGYCLMLPVVRSMDEELSGGARAYLRRRAIRILPPYYAAVAFSLLLIACVPGLRNGIGTGWDRSLPAFSSRALVPHLFLFHNFSDRWIDLINSPLWSIATEWQIYFLLPLLFLPLFRRLGLLAIIGAGLCFGILGGTAIQQSFAGASPYPGLFAFGCAAAAINFSTRRQCVYLRSSIPWRALAAAFMLALGLVFVGSRGFLRAHSVIGDIAIGAIVACLIISCTISILPNSGKSQRLAAVLSSGPLVKLGGFSYSLYLIHFPIVGAVYAMIRPAALSPGYKAILAFAITIPASVCFAYLFYLCVERPCIRVHRRKDILRG